VSRAFQPTQEQRDNVEAMIGFGITEAETCCLVKNPETGKPIDEKTLRKYFKAEIFHSLKTERVHHRIYGTRAGARRNLFQYIEGFYNSCRLHSALGYISPACPERMSA
jgi:hypothetical protein